MVSRTFSLLVPRLCGDSPIFAGLPRRVCDVQGHELTSGVGVRTTAGHAWNREQMYFPVKVGGGRCEVAVDVLL